jgi:hypothetical protein
MTGDDGLADFTADLLAQRSNLPFVERLLSGPAATWTAVASLLGDLPDAADRLSALPEAAELQACWLDFPQSAHGSGYCVVLFFIEDPLWSRAAIYNRALVVST